MVGAFLAIVRPLDLVVAPWIEVICRRAQHYCGLQTVIESGLMQIFADTALPIRRISGGRGVVVGELFRRDGHSVAPSGAIDQTEIDATAESLIRSWWGGYVAFLISGDPAAVHVLRDPSGTLGCYRSTYQGVTVFYSDVALAVRLGFVERRLDSNFAAHYLAYPDLRSARTGVVGVKELLAGQMTSLTLQGDVETCRWTPWTFASLEHAITDRAEAVALVAAETQRCVSAWASRSGAILLELSGGLDSSIVAACLQGQSSAVSALTFATPEAEGDERKYAALVAERTGLALRSLVLAASAADVERVSQRLSPRPGAGLLQQVTNSAISDFVAERHIDSFFGGGGGDNVFCFLGTAAPAADVLRVQGVSALFWRTVENLSAIHGCTYWTACRLALKRALRRPPPWRQNRLFLAPDAVPPEPDFHPWLDRPRNALPGKIEHVASLMRIQNAPDGKDRVEIAPVRYPLLSQPLVELCLRIPSWMWVDGGRNRSVARDAFADRLPAEILQRRGKGDFTGFCGAAFSRQRRALANLLLEGWLAREGLLDREAVEAYLSKAEPPKDLDFFRLLEIAGVETWARSWAG
jgi:asparagine synthase (glutamine-hydrolysing)